LAWERTAISIMVSGVLLARFAASGRSYVVVGVGLVQTAFGGALLVWAGWHYEDLHGQLRSGAGVVHPTATKILGLATIAFSTIALTMAVTDSLATL
jgi:uncharacterized membrane protein YidH (DUF202 family)